MRALLRLGLRQFVAQTVGKPCNDFILQLEEVGDAFLEPVGPEVGRFAINQLRVDTTDLVAQHEPSRM